MKHIVLSLVMLVSSSFSLFSQTNDDQGFRKALETFETIVRNNDADAAKSFLTDNFILFCSQTRMNKEQRLASIKAGQFKYDSFKKEDIRIYPGDTSAAIVVKTTVKYRSGEQDISVDAAVLSFVKKENKWQLAAECYMGLNNCMR